MDMNQYRKHLLALGIAAVCLMVPVFANAQNDYYAFFDRYLYHQLGQSARSAAMGGVYSALQGGDMGLLGNPASLGFLEDRYIMLDFDYEEVASTTSILGGPFAPPAQAGAETQSDLYTIGAGIAYPFEWGALALSYSYRDDQMDSGLYRFSNTSLRQSDDRERHAVSVGGGYRVNDLWAIGYRYSYINWDSDTILSVVRPLPAYQLAVVPEEFEGHRNHFGVQYRPSDILAFGLDGTYGLGDRDSSVAGNADADSWTIQGGVAYQAFEDIPLLLALDLSFENHELTGGGSNIDEDLFGVHLGAEYKVTDNVFLRAGYRYEDYDYKDQVLSINENPQIGGYSAGVGLEYDRYTLDYGFVYTDTGSGDMSHFVGVGIKF